MIRLATLADIPALIELFDAYRVFYRKASDKAGATQFLTERLTQADAVIFVAEQAGQLLGFTQLYPLFSSTRMQRMWLLNDLYVAPEHRGQGWSLQLIDAAKEHVRATAACGLLLETEISNTIGNQLYPRAGFVKNDTTNFYFWATT